MWVMYDSITPATIPAHASAVGGYVGGSWPDYFEEVKRWPHAQHLSIAVNAEEDAICLDIENGDATPDQAPAWVKRQKARGVWKPVVYHSLSEMGTVLAALSANGIHREEVRVWTAHYGQGPHICGPSEGLTTHADGTQWTSEALGRNLDESLCVDMFFEVATGYANPEEANWIWEWDHIKGRRTEAAHLRRLFLKAEMTKRRKLISHKARSERGGWDKLNRKARWHALDERTSS